MRSAGFCSIDSVSFLHKVHSFEEGGYWLQPFLYPEHDLSCFVPLLTSWTVAHQQAIGKLCTNAQNYSLPEIRERNIWTMSDILVGLAARLNSDYCLYIFIEWKHSPSSFSFIGGLLHYVVFSYSTNTRDSQIQHHADWGHTSGLTVFIRPCVVTYFRQSAVVVCGHFRAFSCQLESAVSSDKFRAVAAECLIVSMWGDFFFFLFYWKRITRVN